MTEEQIALARRAVACRGWRWMDGMCFGEPIGRDVVMRRRFDANKEAPPIGAVPILDDPATLGCLLALVREAHAVPFLQVSVKISREHGYRFECNPHHRGQWVNSEAEALVAALENAP